MIFAALCVVTTKNVVHAALWLVVVLAGVAAQYILAAAEFVAVSQVLVYVGAVMVLFLFGIMLTRAQIGRERGLNNRNWAWAIPVAAVLLGLLSWAIIDAFERRARCPTAARRRPRRSPTTCCRRTSCRSSPSPSSSSPPPSAPSSWPGRTERCSPPTSSCSARCCSASACSACIARRNAVMVLMSVELILNAVNLNLIAFALMHGNVDGQVFALYVIAVAAAEVGVGLGMVLLVYRNRRSIALDELSEMKG